ncbi:MAG TPA: hypothetical protein VFG51_01735, partial [Candidatus Saccharimonadia bacterium]|nr:hypothetical protein [Candidatus Saccharimonadia bacterium]
MPNARDYFEFRTTGDIVGLEKAHLPELAAAAIEQAKARIVHDHPTLAGLIEDPKHTTIVVDDKKRHPGLEWGDFMVTIDIVDKQNKKHHFRC